MNDLQIIDDLQNIQQKMLFSSGSPKQDDPTFGSGLYELELDGDVWQHRKVFSGNCYGIENLAKTISLLTKKLEFLNSIVTTK